jgi:hypothetical protein
VNNEADREGLFAAIQRAKQGGTHHYDPQSAKRA